MTCQSALRVSVVLVVMFAIPLEIRGAQSHITAIELLQLCKVEPAADSTKNQLYDMMCTSYLTGWLDAFVVVKTAAPELRGVCLPSDGMSRDLAKTVVVKWLLKNEPEVRRENRTAALAVLQAFAEEYPCPSGPS